MKRFQIDFTGRTKGAIGKFEQFGVFMIAEDRDEAILKLYEHYEHIHLPKVTEMSDAESEA